MTLLCLLLIAVGFALAWPGTAVMRTVGRRLGQMDRPGDRKLHDAPIPATGGVAIFLAIVGPLIAALVAAWVVPEGVWRDLWPALVPHLPGVRSVTGLGAALAASLAGLHLIGLIDDRRALGPGVKLLVQLAAAAGLVLAFDVRLMEAAGGFASALVTILWLIAITNAFNFLDNMDGLAGGVAAICAGLFMAAALIGGQWFIAALLGLLVGALLGFLVLNFPPASIFMGDCGSMVVGFLLAVCAVRVTYYDPAAGTRWWAVFTPLVVLAIPLYDLTSVTLIRLAQGKSPFVGDTQHFSHRLARKGLSKPAAVGVIWACTLASGLGGVMLGRLANWQAALVLAQTLAILLVLALLERTGSNHEDTKSTKGEHQESEV